MTYLFYVCLMKDYLNFDIEISFPFQIPKGHTKIFKTKNDEHENGRFQTKTF